MKIQILFGMKPEIAQVNLHELIATLSIDIMFMTDDLNDQFVEDIYSLGHLGNETANVLIVATDPRITAQSLDRLQTSHPLINYVIAAQTLIAPVRPFNMPDRFSVAPGGRGASKRAILPIRPLSLAESRKLEVEQFYAAEWHRKWNESTQQLIDMDINPRNFGRDISVGYSGTTREQDGQTFFEWDGSVPRIGKTAFDAAELERTLDKFASENPRLFGRTSMSVNLTPQTEEDLRAFHEMIRSLSMPIITVPYHADDFEAPAKLPGDFVIDPKFSRIVERDDPLTSGLKTISDELRRQHAPMPLGSAANYTTARPTWGKATRQQILADLEEIKQRLDND